MPTVVELHYDPHHASLKDFLTQAVAASKANPKGDKFLTYRPLHGGAGHAYIVFRSAGAAAALGEKLGADKAASLAKAGSAGVRARAHIVYTEDESHGDHGAPAPYLLAVGIDHAAASSAAHKETAKHLKAANAGSSPVAYKTMKPANGAGPHLALFPMKSLADLEETGNLNKPRLASHLGKEKAEALVHPLKGNKYSKTILRYVPEHSNP